MGGEEKRGEGEEKMGGEEMRGLGGKRGMSERSEGVRFIRTASSTQNNTILS